MNNYQAMLDELMEVLINESASDLHLSEGRHPTIRSFGNLVPLTSRPLLTAQDTKGLFDLLVTTERHKKIFEDKKEVDFAYSYQNNKARFRGNAYIQQGKVSIALRLIPKAIRTIQELGLPDSLAEFARKQQGFFLVVGPVGQGKTTTLAALIDLINQERTEHIITIEDPIEYIFEQKSSIVDQRQVGLDTGDFESALVSALRQDVDVLLVGEMRSLATMSSAVTAAETGHLVFSTLHTNNAAQTIDRIIDSFPPEQHEQIRLQLSTSLSGILSQRLIPRLSGGLIPAYELLINNSAVSNLIREKRTHEINTVIETGLDQGMVDMNRCLVDLVRKGEISIENAYKYTLNPKVLERLI